MSPSLPPTRLPTGSPTFTNAPSHVPTSAPTDCAQLEQDLREAGKWLTDQLANCAYLASDTEWCNFVSDDPDLLTVRDTCPISCSGCQAFSTTMAPSTPSPTATPTLCPDDYDEPPCVGVDQPICEESGLTAELCEAVALSSICPRRCCEFVRCRTAMPSLAPSTLVPTWWPSLIPTDMPTRSDPTTTPTAPPTLAPSFTGAPSVPPTSGPTISPSSAPTSLGPTMPPSLPCHAEPCENGATCYNILRGRSCAPADILFLMDTSESMTAWDFQLMKGFMVNSLVNLCGAEANSAYCPNLGQDYIRVGLISFGSTVVTNMAFNSHMEDADIFDTFRVADRVGGGTALGAAMQSARELLTPERGYRGRNASNSALVVVTDGCPSDRARFDREVGLFNNDPSMNFIDRYVFAVGSDTCRTELETIAGSSPVIYTPSFDELLSSESGRLEGDLCMSHGGTTTRLPDVADEGSGSGDDAAVATRTLECGERTSGVVNTTTGADQFGNQQKSPDHTYRLILDFPTVVSINTCGSDYDTFLRLYTDDSIVSGDGEFWNDTPILLNDDHSGMCISHWRGRANELDSFIRGHLEAGVYYIAVEGYQIAGGRYELGLNCEYTTFVCLCAEGYFGRTCGDTASPTGAPGTSVPTYAPSRHPSPVPTGTPTQAPAFSDPTAAPSLSPHSSLPTTSPTTDPCLVHGCSADCTGHVAFDGLTFSSVECAEDMLPQSECANIASACRQLAVQLLCPTTCCDEIHTAEEWEGPALPVSDLCGAIECSADCPGADLAFADCGWDREAGRCAAGFVTSYEEAALYLEATPGACNHHTGNPSAAPTTLHPTDQPSGTPSGLPTAGPTALPSGAPTALPSASPTAVPSAIPTTVPSAIPTAVPTAIPTDAPTGGPTREPTGIPTTNPTANPTAAPTGVPTELPTAAPTAIPTSLPSAVPTSGPTGRPSAVPSSLPSTVPPTGTPTSAPTGAPTRYGDTCRCFPADRCFSAFRIDTLCGTSSFHQLPAGEGDCYCDSSCLNHGDCCADYIDLCTTSAPTAGPTRVPTALPSSSPVSSAPTHSPTPSPTTLPTVQPTANPTTTLPTGAPTQLSDTCLCLDDDACPRSDNTICHTNVQHELPEGEGHCVCDDQCSGFGDCCADYVGRCTTDMPTAAPQTPIPTASPTTLSPTRAPTRRPTAIPSMIPTGNPSVAPTGVPTAFPTSSEPSSAPSQIPTTLAPSGTPSQTPTAMPTALPTTSAPSDTPTISAPTVSPTSSPSRSCPVCIAADSPSEPANLMCTKVLNLSVDTVTLCAHWPCGQWICLHPFRDDIGIITADGCASCESWPPSMNPTVTPTPGPTADPSTPPSSSLPSAMPSQDPTSMPSKLPTLGPSDAPSNAPTGTPSAAPSTSPSLHPSRGPTAAPTTRAPTAAPALQPSGAPATREPSQAPVSTPSMGPSPAPSGSESPTSSLPTPSPSDAPASSQPTPAPSPSPTPTPTTHPTDAPATSEPTTRSPTLQPTLSPTAAPATSEPTLLPSEKPSSAAPTSQPTPSPSPTPTAAPSASPATSTPSTSPTSSPTVSPTWSPTANPTGAPTVSTPTAVPTAQPTLSPTSSPTRSRVPETCTDCVGAGLVWQLRTCIRGCHTPLQQGCYDTAELCFLSEVLYDADLRCSQANTTCAECLTATERGLCGWSWPQPGGGSFAGCFNAVQYFPTDGDQLAALNTAECARPPTHAPFSSNAPSIAPHSSEPTSEPTTLAPTPAPSLAPQSGTPSSAPTTLAPTGVPSGAPTSSEPTGKPTVLPTPLPSAGPSAMPSEMPSAVPTTLTPTAEPTGVPSQIPTAECVSNGSPTPNPAGPPSPFRPRMQTCPADDPGVPCYDTSALCNVYASLELIRLTCSAANDADGTDCSGCLAAGNGGHCAWSISEGRCFSGATYYGAGLSAGVALSGVDCPTTTPAPVCPANCGTSARGGGTCRVRGRDGATLCTSCNTDRLGLRGRCLRTLNCRGNQVQSGALSGQSCRCADQNCFYCARTAAGDTCRRCRNGFYFLDNECVVSCPANMASVGISVYGRRCMAPFVCRRNSAVNDDAAAVRVRCKCPTVANTAASNCFSCNFLAGGYGDVCTRCNNAKVRATVSLLQFSYALAVLRCFWFFGGVVGGGAWPLALGEIASIACKPTALPAARAVCCLRMRLGG